MTSDDQQRRPRVLIADDDVVLLYTIRRIVEHHYEVVGEAINGQESVELAMQLRPDVVLLDISMPVFQRHRGDTADPGDTSRDSHHYRQ